jgi:hypothetical protein
LSQVEADRIAALAASDNWASARLGQGNVQLVEIQADGGKEGTLVRYIDYSTMERFTVFLDSTNSTVVGHRYDRDWPNFSPMEEARASDIALHDPDVIARAHGLPLLVNNTTGTQSTGPCADRRCIAVFLTPHADDYEGLIVVAVDLGLGRVVEVIK